MLNRVLQIKIRKRRSATAAHHLLNRVLQIKIRNAHGATSATNKDSECAAVTNKDSERAAALRQRTLLMKIKNYKFFWRLHRRPRGSSLPLSPSFFFGSRQNKPAPRDDHAVAVVVLSDTVANEQVRNSVTRVLLRSIFLESWAEERCSIISKKSRVVAVAVA